MQQVVANINKTTASLMLSSASIEKMLNTQSGSIAQSMDNVNSFTKNLASNNDKLNNSMTNLEKTTENLSKTDIDGSIEKLKLAMDKMNNLLDKVNSKDGSLGLLMNDKTLYNNLTGTMRSANTLLDDLRLHPKRYVSFSIFGRKDKGTVLTAPVSDTLHP
jgi:phospholipid/cholesterol/gamma-HCH transport system substrate-binding protein